MTILMSVDDDIGDNDNEIDKLHGFKDEDDVVAGGNDSDITGAEHFLTIFSCSKCDDEQPSDSDQVHPLVVTRVGAQNHFDLNSVENHSETVLTL